MSEQSNNAQIKSRLRRSLIGLFQIFIVLCLVGGALDIAYPIAKFTKNHLKDIISEIRPPRAAEIDSGLEIIVPTPGFPIRQEPGIRNIAAEYHSPNINVAADGLRQNGQSPPAKVSYVGLLLGSSTAFGYGVADNQTISSHLERALMDVRLYNYAGIGQPTSDSILRWYDLQKKNGKPDFVILAGVSYQLYHDCKPLLKPLPTANTRSNIFVYLANKIADKPTSEQVMPCNSSESLDLAVRNSILAIENAVAFGRKQGIPFNIVYLPTPYDANVNVDNLLKTADIREYILAMRRVYSRYHQELAKLDLPEFIDLSHALPPDKMYFLDEGGHLSKEGNRLIAEILFQRIWGNKNQAGTRLFQGAH